MDKKLLFRCMEYSEHFTGLTGIPCMVMDISHEPRLSYLGSIRRFCTGCRCEKKDEIAVHLYGCKEAHRWNGRYIYYCPVGLVFVASSVSDEHGSLCGALFQGPFVMGPLDDLLAYFPYKEMEGELKNLEVFTPEQVRNLSEIMAGVTAQISGVAYGQYSSFESGQQKILNTLYDAMDKYDDPRVVPRYPVEEEKQLQKLIRSGDREGSMELLNQILGDIYFISAFELNEVKARVLELLVLVSRTAIEAGADAREIFRFNEDNIRKIDCIQDIEKLSMWLNQLLVRFISSSFELRDVKHSEIMQKVIHYIRQNFQKKLSLEEIAGHVGFSRSYLSTIFRTEMNATLSGYINQVRVEKSKVLLSNQEISLAEVALACGFEDQSYYTKIFKRMTGISPKRYRDQGRE